MAMIEVEVQYRLMSPGGYLYAHIVAIGGNNPGWLIPLRDAIDNIENERCRYYVQGHLPFSRVYVHVVKPDALDRSTWYLRTSPSNVLDNNLLWLPSCPNLLNVLTVPPSGHNRTAQN